MFAEVWAAIGQMQTARTAEATSVGANGLRFHSGGGAEFDDGGDLTVRGGSLRMTSEDGTVGLLYFGPAADGDPIWQFSFPNGDGAFGLFGTSGNGFWAGKDHGNNILISNDAASGAGLAEPSLNIPMVPSAGTSIGTGGPFWPEFVNTSYQEVMHCITKLWHPRIAIGVDTSTTSGTVDWELRIDGVTAGSRSGDNTGEFDVPGWGDTIRPGSQRSVQLWCRNTTGTASRVIVDRCYGTKS